MDPCQLLSTILPILQQNFSLYQSQQFTFCLKSNTQILPFYHFLQIRSSRANEYQHHQFDQRLDYYYLSIAL